MNGTKALAKTQLVQNFVGLEPTKTYRLSIKGTAKTTAKDPNSLPGFAYSLKAKANGTPETNNSNLLSTWMKDSHRGYSQTNFPTKLNPYSSKVPLHSKTTCRATHPFFSKSLNSPTSTPRDWGLFVGTVSTESSSIADLDLRTNPGQYTLSMNVFNSTDAPSYFVLSSTNATTPVFYNWSAGGWDAILTGEIPKYGNSTSATYFLTLPSGVNTDKFTPYTFPEPIVFPPEDSNILKTYSDPTEDGIGSRGLYR